MLELYDGHLELEECESCAVKPGTPLLCKSCLHNREVIELLKDEVLSLRRHELDVAEATGVEFWTDGEVPSPSPRNDVLHAIKEHKQAWDQAQTIKRLFEVTGRSGEKPLDGKTPAEWLEESLGKIKEIEERILAKLTPKEKEVLKKRFPKP